MSLSRAELEQKIRDRFSLLYGGDFQAYLAANLDAAIDAALKEIADEAVSGIVKPILLELLQKPLSRVGTSAK